MNKKGKIVVTVLVVLGVILLTSAGMLMLIKTGMLSVKTSSESVLNTEYIPYQRTGSLAIKDFKFCLWVDETFDCVGEKKIFVLGDEVHFRFVVESSVYQRQIRFIENYQVKGPSGKILLSFDPKNNYYFKMSSAKKMEKVSFRDFFTVGHDMPIGNYTLELLITNSLLNKKTQVVKTFEMQ
tara:strand:- start:92 stop:637 length:546 start_codon:yes stop_codon:yes gene_type:complete